ncbi:hypothetical protein BLNAU_12115 [Blattamonas nauphoetae]|uniref:Secreted protein n=1 Tax=Blattamonas nauphoetae TaxID=2049346 RepID=A0ABQ9XMF6_9EUKA|nr:hypothetical protein BLNAU_12115 [Blattamonas nauphoetae]
MARTSTYVLFIITAGVLHSQVPQAERERQVHVGVVAECTSVWGGGCCESVVTIVAICAVCRARQACDARADKDHTQTVFAVQKKPETVRNVR